VRRIHGLQRTCTTNARPSLLLPLSRVNTALAMTHFITNALHIFTSPLLFIHLSRARHSPQAANFALSCDRPLISAPPPYLKWTVEYVERAPRPACAARWNECRWHGTTVYQDLVANRRCWRGRLFPYHHQRYRMVPRKRWDRRARECKNEGRGLVSVPPWHCSFSCVAYRVSGIEVK